MTDQFIDTGYCLIKRSKIDSVRIEDERIVIRFAGSEVWCKDITQLPRDRVADIVNLPCWDSQKDREYAEFLSI